jgi:hypothetical protein
MVKGSRKSEKQKHLPNLEKGNKFKEISRKACQLGVNVSDKNSSNSHENNLSLEQDFEGWPKLNSFAGIPNMFLPRGPNDLKTKFNVSLVTH